MTPLLIYWGRHGCRRNILRQKILHSSRSDQQCDGASGRERAAQSRLDGETDGAGIDAEEVERGSTSR